MAEFRRSLLLALAALGLLAAAPSLVAYDFPTFVSRFGELRLPTLLDAEAANLAGGGSIPIEEFEAFVLAPAHFLAASRPRLRGLDGWAARIREYRSFEGHPDKDENSRSLSFSPIGRWRSGSSLLLALYCEASTSWVDGGESEESGYLLSFSSSGRLLDGFEFRGPHIGRPSIASEGGPILEDAELSVDGEGRVTALDRYGVDDFESDFVTGEAWLWEISLSPIGLFTSSSQERRFLLSRVYAGSGEGAPRLYVYETEARKAGDPLFFIRQEKEASSWAYAAGGWGDSRDILARGGKGRDLRLLFEGEGRVTVLDGDRRTSLDLAYGPGGGGEPTSMRGIMLEGDLYERSSETWTYLFAEASLPAGSADRRAIFRARSFVLGTRAAGREGSPDRLVALGILKDDPLGLVRSFSQEPSDTGDPFRTYRAGIGSVALPAGTRIGKRPNEGLWALVPKETSISLPGQRVRAPAGSRFDFDPGDGLGSADFPVPVEIRLGSATASIYSVAISGVPPYGFKEVLLASPFAMSIAGKKLSLTDRLTFDEKGVLRSGRLAAEVELAAGGRTLPLSGGYDPEWPEAGIVEFYPGGGLLSGTLAKDLELQTPSASLSLAAGDALSFEKNGSLASLRPIGLVSLGSRSGKIVLRPTSVDFRPDGSLVLEGPGGEDYDSRKGALSLSALRATCNDTRVRVRSQPDLEAPTLDYLNKGDRLLVLDKSSEPMQIGDAKEYWYRVRRASDGLVGWSYGLFLKMEG